MNANFKIILELQSANYYVFFHHQSPEIIPTAAMSCIVTIRDK